MARSIEAAKDHSEKLNELKSIIDYIKINSVKLEDLSKIELIFKESILDIVAVTNNNKILLSENEIKINNIRDILDKSYDFLQKNSDSAFSKIDALLLRQVFSLPQRESVVCRNSAGLFLIPESDIDAIAYYSDGTLPEPGTLSVLNKLLIPGGRFVDVGANLGLFSVVASRRVGTAGRVWAIEPTPSTIAALKVTLQLNGVDKIVTLLECAAGAEKGEAKLHIGRTCGHNSILPLDDAKDMVDVPVVALDTLLSGERVDVIKIDVEGWEMNVLKGLENTLRANPQISVILEFGPSHLKRANYGITEWLDELRKFDMDLYEIDEWSGALNPLRATGLEIVESINLLMTNHLPAGLAS